MTVVRRLLGGLLAILVLGMACAPVGPSRPAAPSSGAEAASPRQTKQLVIALEGEPDNLLFRMGRSAGINVSQTISLALHRHLAGFDERGNAYPVLATELPSTSNGTWVVRDDGTMQTTYRLRRDVTWHDGTPLTAHDFVFAWTVTNNLELPIFERSTAQQIRSIETPDDYTLVMEWAASYPFAN